MTALFRPIAPGLQAALHLAFRAQNRRAWRAFPGPIRPDLIGNIPQKCLDALQVPFD